MHRSSLFIFAALGIAACDAPEGSEADTSDPIAFSVLVSPPAWAARHDMTASAYQAEFDRRSADGYRLVWISGYEGSSGQALYAAIWEKSSGPAYVARHGLTGAQYQSEFDDWTARGYRLSLVNGYGVGGTAYYAAIFEQRSGGAWTARHGMTGAQYQAEFDARTAAGYRLTDISGYSIGGTAYYAAIFEQRSGSAWVARHGMSSANYQAAFDNQYYSGYRLRKVVGYNAGGTPRFAALWDGGAVAGDNSNAIDAQVSSFMQTYSVPGLAIALAKDGRLVFARGYGYADSANGVETSPLNRFRIASVSKPFTSAGILTLMEQGRLSLDDRVFGTGGILGTTYGSPPYFSGVNQITVRELLSHTGGGWNNTTNDPMFSHPSYDQSELIDWVLENRPLDNTPGTHYAYSNFGYCVLGRVIEAKTGRPYDAWMKDQILAPAGITRMAIGGDTLADRMSGEVVYYGQNGENPYGMEVTRMDSHGGWIASPIDLVRFALSVDGFSTKPDILEPATIDQMTTGSSANPGYALGWAVNSSDNWWHSGSLPGTQSILVRASNGYTWAVVVNTRSGLDGFGGDLDALTWNILAGVSSWPSYDLF